MLVRYTGSVSAGSSRPKSPVALVHPVFAPCRVLPASPALSPFPLPVGQKGAFFSLFPRRPPPFLALPDKISTRIVDIIGRIRPSNRMTTTLRTLKYGTRFLDNWTTQETQSPLGAGDTPMGEGLKLKSRPAAFLSPGDLDWRADFYDYLSGQT